MTTDTINTYEIGGVCVQMTAEQAERWNSGETNEQDMLLIECAIPSRRGGSSRLIDGEVIVEDGMPTTGTMLLCQALEDSELSRMMDGMPANRTN